MDYMAAAMRGDIEAAAEMSFDCVMCGLCTARCPAEIAQYNIAILGRRLYGRQSCPRAAHLAEMVAAVESGRYEKDLRALMAKDMATPQEDLHRQGNRADGPAEIWEPADKEYL